MNFPTTWTSCFLDTSCNWMSPFLLHLAVHAVIKNERAVVILLVCPVCLSASMKTQSLLSCAFTQHHSTRYSTICACTLVDSIPSAVPKFDPHFSKRYWITSRCSCAHTPCTISPSLPRRLAQHFSMTYWTTSRLTYDELDAVRKIFIMPP